MFNKKKPPKRYVSASPASIIHLFKVFILKSNFLTNKFIITFLFAAAIEWLQTRKQKWCTAFFVNLSINNKYEIHGSIYLEKE